MDYKTELLEMALQAKDDCKSAEAVAMGNATKASLQLVYVKRLIAENNALRDALQSVLGMDVKGHALQDRLQFSAPSRELLAKCNSALAEGVGHGN